MLGRKFVIALGALVFAVVGSVSGAGADQPEHVVGSGATAQLDLGDPYPTVSLTAIDQQVAHNGASIFTVGVYIAYSPSRATFGYAVLEESQLTVDEPLRGASLTATIDGVTCSNFSPWCFPTTINLDVQWSGEGTPANYPLGQAKQEDNDPPFCHVNSVGHVMSRDAVVTGTVSDEFTGLTTPQQVLGSGLLERSSFPHADGGYC